ncbi:hypothetical protein AKJ36_03595 [candidate division MSBL1 archaeon SCGC-AAA259I07]|uniref:Uncharacterized protein n=1 Tax=candidate division MSBL1 archaeon SCGC-AAA259I07 TaxID=1698266 RepID=A0A133UIB6_9EURY|nr:hypothetical protein AKJ36_03595 [candidate division MSBL1 archaeon SCGC-AAA259I07]
MTDEVVCAVPGCDNELTEEERKEKKAVCSSCELAEMHLCGICGKQISPSRIRGGATLCKECEMNQPDLQSDESEFAEYVPESYMTY